MKPKTLGIFLLILFFSMGAILLYYYQQSTTRTYAYSGGELWLNDGQWLAIPNDNVIQIMDCQNRLVQEIILPTEQLPQDYTLYLFDEGIVAKGKERQQLITHDDKYYQFFDLSLWNWKGERVHQETLAAAIKASGTAFNELELLKHSPFWPKTTETDYYDLNVPYWVDENYLVLDMGLRMISFDLRDGHTTLLHDMSDRREDYQRRLLQWSGYNTAISEGSLFFTAYDAQSLLMKFTDGICELLFDHMAIQQFWINKEMIVVKVADDKSSCFYGAFNDSIKDFFEVLTYDYALYDEMICQEYFAAIICDVKENLIKSVIFDAKQKTLTFHALTKITTENSWLPLEFVGIIPYKNEFIFAFTESLTGGYVLCDDEGQIKEQSKRNNIADYMKKEQIVLGNNRTHYPAAGCYLKIIFDEENRQRQIRIERI